MTEEMIYVIGTACFSVLSVEASPIIRLKEWLGFENDAHYDSGLRTFLRDAMYCSMCSAFWFSLVAYPFLFRAGLVLPLACITSVAAALLEKQVRK